MDWETSFATYINPFPLFGCKCCLVAALAYSFSKSTRVSFTCKRNGSLLTWVSHLSSPSDGLSSFPQDHIRRWCQGRAENWVPEIFTQTGIEPGTFVLVVRCTNHYTTALFTLLRYTWSSYTLKNITISFLIYPYIHMEATLFKSLPHFTKYFPRI